DTILCNINDSLVLDVYYPNATYLWSNSATTSSITIGQSGLNTYFVTIFHDGCSYSDTINVFKTILAADSLEIHGLCQIQDRVDVNAFRLGGSFSDLWNISATTSSIRATQTGQYFVQISDGFCSVTDSFIVVDNRDSVFVSDT